MNAQLSQLSQLPPLAAPTQPQVVHYHHYYQAQKSPGVAAVLEVLPGIFQVFGMGHIYAGNIVSGLFVMLGWWALCAINAALMAALIGFVTWPLCWLIAVFMFSQSAAGAARADAQRQAGPSVV